MNSIQTSILKTVIWFDIFEYPLTLLEVWKWLWVGAGFKPALTGGQTQPGRETNLSDVWFELEELVKSGRLERTEAFYHLPGRAHYVRIRKERYVVAEFKFKKALKFARLFRFVPG